MDESELDAQREHDYRHAKYRRLASAEALLAEVEQFFEGWCPTTCSCARTAEPLHGRIIDFLTAGK